MIFNWIFGTSESTSIRGEGRKEDDDTRSLLQRRPNHSPRVILGMTVVCVLLSTIDRMHGNEPQTFGVATTMNNMVKQTSQSSSSPVEGFYNLEQDEFHFENGDIIDITTMMKSDMENTSTTTATTTMFSETLKDIENKLVIRNMIKHFVDNVIFSSSSNDNNTLPEEQQIKRRLNEAEVAATTTTTTTEAEGTTTDGGVHSVAAASEEATTHSSELSPEEEHEQEVSIETDFWSLYRALVFLICIYVAGQLALLVGMPSLFGEIVIGFLMGPPLANFVPYAPSFVLIGEIGLIMLLLEAGIDIDVAQLKVTGLRAILIAFTGAFGALAVGIGLSYAMGVTQWQACIALGASFSPTSLAVASNALSSGKVLNTPVGQLIVAACVIDDVIGLVILSLLEVLIEEEAQIHKYFMPLISAVVFLGGLGYVAIIWMPRWVERFIYKKLPEAWHTPVCFTLMIVLLMAYMPLMYISKASYLTGAFLAGLSFSQIPPIHHAFVHYTANLFAWLLRVFFSSSIGFQVPIKFYKDPSIVGWGFAFYVAVLAKLPLGLYSPRFTKTIPKGYPFDPYWRDVILTGIAMTSRGEFSFIIASFAISSNLATPEQYAAVVWAVLLSCATSPFMLLSTIRYYNNLLSGLSDDIEEMEVPKDRKVPLYMSIQARTGVIWGLRDKLDRAVDELGLITIDHRSWHPRGLHATVVTEIYVQDSQVMLTVPLEEEEDAVEKGTISSSSEPSDKVPEQGTTNNGEHGSSDNVVPHSIPTDQEKAENEMVAARCEEVRVALLNALGTDAVGSEIQVSEWRPAKFMRRHDVRKSTTVEEDYTNGGGGDGGAGGAASATTTGEDDFTLDEEQAAYVKQQVQRQLEHKELIDTNLELYPSQEDRAKKIRTKTISGPIAPPSNTERFMLHLDNIGEEQQQPQEGTDGAAAAAAAGGGGTTTATMKPTTKTASGMERPTSAATFSGGIMSHPGMGGRTVSTPTGVSFADGTRPTSAVSATNGFVGGTTTEQQQQLLHQQRVAARRMQRQKQVSTPYTAKRSMWDTDEVAQQAALQGAEATAAVVSSPSSTIMDIESGSPSYGTGGARLRQRRTKPQRRKMQSDFFMDRIREEMPTIEERLGGIVRQEITFDEQTGEPMEGSRRQLQQQQRQRQSSLTNLFRPSSPKQS